MILAAAVCPHPPLLFRELTGRQDVAAELRAACVAAVASVTSGDPEVVVVVGGHETSRSWDSSVPFDVRAFGTTHPRGLAGRSPSTEAERLPLSLGVARRLLDGAGWRGAVEMHTVAWDATQSDVAGRGGTLGSRPERIALLVLGEGSTRRGEKAPGYFDQRAFGYDEATGRALETADIAALQQMDPGLAEDLMVSGRAPLGVLAAAAQAQGSNPQSKLLYQDDPWGVMYFVATWHMS